MNVDNRKHYSYLKEQYDEVGKCTWKYDDLMSTSLDISRNYFTETSLVQRKPEPKELEVYALLSGLPFSEKITNELVAVQKNISAILSESLHYWVQPMNFGLEYCVFKWPNDNWDESLVPVIKQELSKVDNPDGCIVAKGYDEMATVFKIREHLKSNSPFLPKKQSGWAHVPIGRILEPLGAQKFLELSRLIGELNNTFAVSDIIKSIKFVHESRLYMEEKIILSEYHLS